MTSYPWFVLGLLTAVFVAVWGPMNFWPGRGFILDVSTLHGNPKIIKRGMVRQQHLAGILFATACLWRGASPGAGAAGTMLYHVLSVLFVAFAALSIVQFLLNRPRFVVPRRYRNEPGFLADAFRGLR